MININSSILIACLVILFSSFLSQPSLAQASKGHVYLDRMGDKHNKKGGHKLVAIKEVLVTFGPPDTLTIRGERLALGIRWGAVPVVTLGENETPLTLIGYNAKEIIVECPPNDSGTPICAVGDYRLTVSSDDHHIAGRWSDSYDLTIGSNLALAGQVCAGTAVMKGFDANGDIVCQEVSPPITQCGENGVYLIGCRGPAGGIVFHVTDGGLHGLEAAPADQSTGSYWGCYGIEVPGADGTEVGTGAQNTADILAAGCWYPALPVSSIAAKVADVYVLNGYDDWFLPSVDELDLLYQLEAIVGGMSGIYWSSSETWNANFAFGVQGPGIKQSFFKDNSFKVRAIRAF